MTKSPIKSPDLKETITMEEFEDAVRQVLSSPVSNKSLYENRKPTVKELSKRWGLVARK